MIDLGLRTSKQVVSREHGSVYCEASVTPVGIETTRRRNPVALVLCLDRSGSMGESSGGSGRQHGQGYQTKMHYARSAAQQAVAQLLDGDSIGLVTFSADARVDIPLTQVGPSSREAMLARIGMIGPEASTNLAAGVVAAAAQFGPTLRRELPCKIVVLSDGLANVGVADVYGLTGLAREYGQAGVTISTIGVGDDYSAETMSAIAQAAGGEFYHVGDPGEIEAAVAAEVADIKTVAARQAELRVSVPPLIAVGGNLNLLPQEDVPGGVVITLGDVVRARQVIFEIATPVSLPGQQVAISVECRYVDPATGQHSTVVRSVSLALVTSSEFARATSDLDVTSLVQEMV